MFVWHAFADYWNQDHKAVFDGVNRLIIVHPSTMSLDIKSDVYSAWKEWVGILNNAKYDMAIRTIGGDPTVEGQRAGDIFFLVNGWKLIIDFTATAVSGILFSDDFDTAYYDEYEQPLYPAQVSSTVNAVETLQTIVSEETVVGQYNALASAIAALQTLTPTEAAQLMNIWQDMGLDIANPTGYTDDGTTTTKVSGDVTLEITDTSVTRQ